MSLVDWRILSATKFLGRIAENATPREQASTFLQVCGMIRSEGLRAIILDMDHAVAGMPAGAVDFGAGILAEEMHESGLRRFALVHRGIEGSWWEAVVAELCKLGVDARGFPTVDEARTWVTARESEDPAS